MVVVEFVVVVVVGSNTRWLKRNCCNGGKKSCEEKIIKRLGLSGAECRNT